MRQPLAPPSLPIPILVAWFLCPTLRFGHHRALSLCDSFFFFPIQPFPSASFLLLLFQLLPGGRSFILCTRYSIRADLHCCLLPSHYFPSSLPPCPQMSPFRPQMSPFRKQYITPSIRGSLLATCHSQPESPLTTPN